MVWIVLETRADASGDGEEGGALVLGCLFNFSLDDISGVWRHALWTWDAHWIETQSNRNACEHPDFRKSIQQKRKGYHGLVTPPHVKGGGSHAGIVLFPSGSMIPPEKDRCNPIKAGRKEISFLNKKSYSIRYNTN